MSALNIWRLVSKLDSKTDRFYYQCWVHLAGVGRFQAQVGFVCAHPFYQDDEKSMHEWANAVVFEPGDRTIRWKAFPEGVRFKSHALGQWSPQRLADDYLHYTCFLRVELDFVKAEGAIHLNGALLADHLPISGREVTPHGWKDHVFRLDRWGIEAPRRPDDQPDNEYVPYYLDIDDLEFGIWEPQDP